jgi:hypothetical protein
MTILTAETEAEFAAALDQAPKTPGVSVQAPAEVAERFGLIDCGPDSAEAADVDAKPWIEAVAPESGVASKPMEDQG